MALHQEGQKTSAVKSTESVRKVRGIVKNMYAAAREAKLAGRPVAYCMVGSFYDEILKVMGITPIWTENYAGLCAAKRDAERFLLKAEADGYSNVICGYVRTGLGFDSLRSETGEAPPNAPDGGMALPDLMLGSSRMCDPRYKWYQALGRYMNVPTFSFDVVSPPVDADLDKVREQYIRYQTEEFQELVDFLEKTTGKKMDYDRLSEVMDIAEKTQRVWWEAYELRKAIPCPMPAEDAFSLMVPARYRLGDVETLDFYKELKAELEQRVTDKKGVIPEEKHRLVWAGGLPPWHTLWIFNYFESRGAVFVRETAGAPWEPIEIPSTVTNPLERLAWRIFLMSTDRFARAQQNSGSPAAELVLDWVREYRADGLVMHATRSCRATTVGQLYLKDVLQRFVKVPALQLTSDIIDVRDYSEADWKSRIDAFMESVNSGRNDGRRTGS